METLKIIKKVKPIIIYPKCLLEGRKQDCFNCDKRSNCKSPRSMCLTPYHNHPKGCPNFGKKNGCPPNVFMFDQVFDMDKDIYAIVTSFDLKSHIEYMRNSHPNWSNYQIRNSRYWQGIDKSNHKKFINELLRKNEYSKLIISTWGESMGINIIETMKQLNIDLIFPPESLTYRISFAGTLINEREKDFEIKDNVIVKQLIK